MSLSVESLRVATAAEAEEDVRSGDFFYTIPLGRDAAVVEPAARQLWGPPGTSILPGEMVWRLRCDGHPVYVSLHGVGGPVMMFHVGNLPDVGDAERLVADVERLLMDQTRGD